MLDSRLTQLLFGPEQNNQRFSSKMFLNRLQFTSDECMSDSFILLVLIMRWNREDQYSTFIFLNVPAKFFFKIFQA